jgi:hypothetical protein
MATYVEMLGVLMETTTCCTCGVRFAAPQTFLQKRLEKGDNFYCPNGHVLHFGESTVDELRRKLAATVARADQQSAEIRELRNSRNALKGHVTRVKKRVANGVCPCCKRHFANLERHMHDKHRDFATTQAES